jgi:hypothetical protein
MLQDGVWKNVLPALRMTQFRHRRGERTPNALSDIEGKYLRGLQISNPERAVIGDRNREEFEYLGQHDVLV